MSKPFDLTATPIEAGTTLIEASAGTGKTYCISGMVLRALIEEPRRDISQILVATFTKAAAEELSDRIRRFIDQAYVVFGSLATEGSRHEVEPFIRTLAAGYPEDAWPEVAGVLRNALLRFDELTVGTIHSFCKQTLEHSAFESGMPFQQEFVKDAEQLRLDVARDFWRRHIYTGDPLLAALTVADEWEPDGKFFHDHQNWRRYPGAELVPGDGDLEATLAALRAACADAARAYDRAEVEAYFSDVKLRKYKRGRTSEATLVGDLDAVERFLIGGDESEFMALWLFLPEQAAGVVDRRSKAGKKRGAESEDQKFFTACRAVREAAGVIERILRVAFIAEVEREFEAERRRQVTVTFNDLITLMHEALADDARRRSLRAAVRRQYSIVFIDEFQDTDTIQYEIFHDLFPDGPLFVIGDPKQAIFGFRGADIFAYLRARREASRTYTLDENFRSSAPMVESVNAVFGVTSEPFVFEEIPFEAARAAENNARPLLAGDTRLAMHWILLPELGSIPKAGRFLEPVVAAEIVALLDGAVTLGGRDLVPRDIAILVRKHEEAERLQAVLRRAGVTAVTGGSDDVFASDEARELERVLTAVVAPTGPTARVRAALATRLWGMRADEIRDLAQDDAAWGRLLDELNDYHRIWLGDGFMPMMARLITGREVRSGLLSVDGGTRALTNLMHVVELVHETTHDRALSPHGTLAWLAVERAQAQDGSDRGETESKHLELRLESDADAVRIVTMHSAKGLEYEIVFCPYLWESRVETGKQPVIVHEGEGYERIVFAHGSEEIEGRLERAEAERMSNDLRLAYVALTRAKQRCYVFGGALGETKALPSALRYLVAPYPDEEAGDVEAASLWEGGVRTLVEANGERMSLSALDSVPDWRRLGAREVESAGLVPRELARGGPELAGQLRAWRATSFSAIKDMAVDGAADVELPERSDPVLVPPRTAAQPEPRGIFAFAKGTAAGHCLHEIFEHADFRAACSEAGLPDDATRQLIAERLRNYGFDQPSAHAGAIDPQAVTEAMVGAVCRHQLPEAGFALRDTAASARLVEWHFYTPLGGLDPRGLAALFAGAAGGQVAEDYSGRLARLDPREIEGYLTGIIDLVFEHEGRWYLIDWKSNHLGHALADYGPSGMWRSMCEHDYVLQYHLYSLALHRYLRARLPGYDYEKHFGAVYYVFLRGVGDDGEEGWYRDRPPLELIEALDRAAGMREAA